MAQHAYVAGRFGDWRIVRSAQALLRHHGYAITHDWTVHAIAGDNERDGSMTDAAMRAAAQTDLEAAKAADLFVLMCTGDMAGALGCYVELGAAASAGRRIEVVGPPRGSIFWHLPGVSVFPCYGDWAAARNAMTAA